MLLVSTISYFSMASNLGATPIQTEFRAQGTRQIWVSRYDIENQHLLMPLVVCALHTVLHQLPTASHRPPLCHRPGFDGDPDYCVLRLGRRGLRLGRRSGPEFLQMGLLCVWSLCILLHLVSLIHASTAFIIPITNVTIRLVLLAHGPRTNFNAGPGVRSGYIRGAGFVGFITMLYPIAWAVSEGGNVISPTSEMVWYGVLDLLLGPVFLYYFVFGIRNIDYNAFGLQSWKYSDTFCSGSAAGVVASTPTPGPVAPVSAGLGAMRYPKAAEAGMASYDALPAAANTTAPVTTSASAPGGVYGGTHLNDSPTLATTNPV